MNGTIAMLMTLFAATLVLFMYSVCRVASLSDRQDEAMFRKWLLEHPEEVDG